MAAEVAADPLSQLECQICFESSSAPRTWHECSSCRGTFCFNCTRWYVQFKITEGEVSKKKLVCPAPQCQRALTSEEVARVVLPDALAKYEAFLRNQEPGIRFCPRAGCCAVLREPRFSTTRQVKCASCQQESCMRCGGEYHKLPLCRRFEKRFGHWRKHHNCDEEFCWSCLRPWMQHDETLCLPLAFIRSKNPKFGCWAPLRVVTKTTLVGVGLVVGVAGVGVAIVVLPPLVAFHAAKNSYRRWQHRHDPLY
ncbi:TPA: hypothetical protein N0F65_012607 [Lagenidium giganteum]|uniref:RBR-type E3 ubiquitin transferase n=1 Tax=Lagenidium giganteum TaxID=4803 RepID=A0AAV2YNZ5_9STRA|nr:TPA: hypothetical protein N0F65_012607 [Lagenidium giganteum]